MRFAVLVSGQGSNLQALLDAANSRALAPAEISLVVSNRPGVPALDRARRAGVPAIAIDHKSFQGRAPFENAVLAALAEHAVEAVILAGFMRVLTDRFIGEFRYRVLNTHPALCPAFPGLDAPAQALEHGVKVSGCTVHFVDEGVDTGPIIFQAAVPIEPDDTPQTLHDRIRGHERRLLPQAARLLAQGRLQIEGRRVTIKEEGDALR